MVGTLMRLGDQPLQQVDVIPTGAFNLDIALGIEVFHVDA